MAAKETLLGCAVVLVAAAIVLGIGLAGRRRDADRGDAEQMRRLYVGLSLYEESYGGIDPPNLMPVAAYLSGPAAFLSGRDPYAAAKVPRYPADGSLPDGPSGSPYRISFAYVDDFHAVSSSDPRVVLADEWIGSVTATGDFHAQVAGPVLRVGVDGAVSRARDRGGPKPLGNVQDLFGHPKP